MPLFHPTTSSEIHSTHKEENNRQTNHLIDGDETGLRQHRKNRGRVKRMRATETSFLHPHPPEIIWSRDLTTYDVITLTLWPLP
ncbi:hypothetical protein CEXT_599351 [Caerostris extrusa]|uniref:Uncharacterized protein n=1 Tax=Caerostris extrusa TaxID=172846 RepID=A0AAV4P5Z5_CAEEX|nr:hypothetical protein CEXT_599351 [Caerostris extrusa]